MPYFLHICCMLPPPCKYSFTAASFFSAVYVFIPRCVNPATPSFSYMLIHIFTVSWSAPTSRAASLILIFCLKYSRTIFTFSSAPIFCFCGITMLPLCLTVFFPFTVSHRGSISPVSGLPFMSHVMSHGRRRKAPAGARYPPAADALRKTAPPERPGHRAPALTADRRERPVFR